MRASDRLPSPLLGRAGAVFTSPEAPASFGPARREA